MNTISRLPYDMVTLSPQEWRAITAVATGIYSPDHTPYPERLAPIKEVLVESGIFYNLREQPLRSSPYHADGSRIPKTDGSSIGEKWRHPDTMGR